MLDKKFKSLKKKKFCTSLFKILPNFPISFDYLLRCVCSTQKSLTSTHSIVTKCFQKHGIAFCSSFFFLNLKQNLMQVLCFLKTAIYTGFENRCNTKIQRYINTRNSRTRSPTIDHSCWYTNSKRLLLSLLVHSTSRKVAPQIVCIRFKFHKLFCYHLVLC